MARAGRRCSPTGRSETKEILGGFYLLEVADLDEALKWAQQIPGAWYGKVEVRPIMEFEQE